MNFIDSLFQCVTQSVRGRDVLLINRVTDCSFVILRISSFASIALVHCSVVPSWYSVCPGRVAAVVANDLATNNHSDLMYSIFILLLTSNCELTINQPKSLIVLHYFRHELINIVENLAKGEVPKLFSYKSDGCFKNYWCWRTERFTNNNHRAIYGKCFVFTEHLTLKLPEVNNVQLLMIMSIHYPTKMQWEYSNLSDRSCYLDLTPNSRNKFTRKFVAARGEN